MIYVICGVVQLGLTSLLYLFLRGKECKGCKDCNEKWRRDDG